MTITFTHPTSSRTLYINRNRVTIGITATRGFDPARATADKCRAMDEALALMAEAPVFTGDLSRHTETGFCAVMELADGWTLAGTDVANVGGMRTGSDGFYVIRNGRIVLCGRQLTSAPNLDWGF